VEEEKAAPFKPINIREVFISKNPQLARFMPGFAYRFISSVMQINYVNKILERHGHLRGTAFINKVVEEFNVKLYFFMELRMFRNLDVLYLQAIILSVDLMACCF
jgi:hypothetical protein